MHSRKCIPCLMLKECMLMLNYSFIIKKSIFIEIKIYLTNTPIKTFRPKILYC